MSVTVLAGQTCSTVSPCIFFFLFVFFWGVGGWSRVGEEESLWEKLDDMGKEIHKKQTIYSLLVVGGLLACDACNHGMPGIAEEKDKKNGVLYNTPEPPKQPHLDLSLLWINLTSESEYSLIVLLFGVDCG